MCILIVSEEYKLFWILNCQKYPNSEHLAVFGGCFSLAQLSCFARLQKSEMHRITSELSWTLNCPNPVYTEYLPPKNKCWSVSLYGQPYSRYKVAENRKCTEWPQTFNTWLSKVHCIHWILIPEVQIFIDFALRPARFRDKMFSKIKNVPNDPQIDLDHLTDKSTPYPLNTFPWGPNFTPFRSMIATFGKIAVFWFPYMLQDTLFVSGVWPRASSN